MQHAQETHRERLGQLPMEVRSQETDINFLVWDVEAARVPMPLTPHAQTNRLHHLNRLGVSRAIPIRPQFSIVDKPGEAESHNTAVSAYEPVETGGELQACVASTPRYGNAKPPLACASGGSILGTHVHLHLSYGKAVPRFTTKIRPHSLEDVAWRVVESDDGRGTAHAQARRKQNTCSSRRGAQRCM